MDIISSASWKIVECNESTGVVFQRIDVDLDKSADNTSGGIMNDRGSADGCWPTVIRQLGLHSTVPRKEVIKEVTVLAATYFGVGIKDLQKLSE